MISAIQILLLAGVVIIGIYSYQKLRSSYLDAILIFVFLTAGIFFIFFPDTTTRIAHMLGVGRGVDMIFYLSILFFAFLVMKLYAKVRKLEQTITTLIRNQSIKDAISPGNEKNDD